MSAEVEAPGTGGDASIAWLELFFDLVVVAAVAVLAEGLREDASWLGVGLFVILYAGIWFSWVSVVLYANVAGEDTRTNTVIIAMFLVAMMAATAPIHFEERANAFAIGFVVLRLVVSRGSLKTGRILASWPVLQLGGATAPWIIAMWVDDPWKYALWALGLGLDLVFAIRRGGSLPETQLAHLQHRVEHGRSTRPRVQLAVVVVNREHLQDRLGGFMIIVLGEAVSQLVLVASTTEWTGDFVGPIIPSFLTLVGLWYLTFSYGYAGAPNARMALLEPRFGLPMHLLSTAGVVAMAAGFGEIAAHPDEPLPESMRWITCAGLALHFGVMAVSGATGGAPRRWLLGWALPCTLVPIVVALVGDHVESQRMLWCFVACIGWMAAYGRFAGPSGRTRPDGSESHSGPR